MIVYIWFLSIVGLWGSAGRGVVRVFSYGGCPTSAVLGSLVVSTGLAGSSTEPGFNEHLLKP